GGANHEVQRITPHAFVARTARENETTAIGRVLVDVWRLGVIADAAIEVWPHQQQLISAVAQWHEADLKGFKGHDSGYPGRFLWNLAIQQAARIARHTVEIFGVHQEGQLELTETVDAVDGFSLLFGTAECREQQRSENGDDGDHHQQLNEREPAPSTKTLPTTFHVPSKVTMLRVSGKCAFAGT